MASQRNVEFRHRVGKRLRELRVTAGISSQEKLAHLAGVDRTYIGRLEQGRSGVTIETLAAILSCIGVSLRQFFGPFDAPVRPRSPRRRE